MFRTVIAGVLAAGVLAAPLCASAFAQTAPAASTAAPKAAQTKKPVSAGQQAMRERQKKCGAEWKEAKTAGKVDKGMTWPKYWSACNKRLKGGG